MDEADRAARLEFLRTFLAERDMPCPLCGYNLRALQAGQCPECGSEVEVTVGLMEPRMGAFVAGGVGLAIGLGFNGLLMAWIGWMMLARPRSGPGLEIMLPLIVGFVMTAGALVGWLKSRRRIRQETFGARVVLVMLCYGLSFGFAAWFFAVAR